MLVSCTAVFEPFSIFLTLLWVNTDSDFLRNPATMQKLSVLLRNSFRGRRLHLRIIGVGELPLEEISAQIIVPRPIGDLHLHGGGYLLGSARDENLAFLESCALSYKYFSTQYAMTDSDGGTSMRVFPLQLVEALSAYYFLVQTLKVAPDRILPIGDIAGAHLTLSLERYLLESKCFARPAGIILFSPWCDMTDPRNPSIKKFLGSLASDLLHSPYFCPAFHPPPSHWPATFVSSETMRPGEVQNCWQQLQAWTTALAQTFTGGVCSFVIVWILPVLLTVARLSYTHKSIHSRRFKVVRHIGIFVLRRSAKFWYGTSYMSAGCLAVILRDYWEKF
ncbi:AB hydrolase superfamily protein C4A8.06c [Grifola frondosa]|uniref:AB hydrolase superfamily protein C4A8.06c n=1 Tax=Grifola frondosa TaxID=5627 RepID=A0A1C7MQR6_GRIFR|nr:AB hydrolase superfamily protein C4A8.06c [Grifola frondosa]